MKISCIVFEKQRFHQVLDSSALFCSRWSRDADSCFLLLAKVLNSDLVPGAVIPSKYSYYGDDTGGYILEVSQLCTTTKVVRYTVLWMVTLIKRGIESLMDTAVIKFVSHYALPYCHCHYHWAANQGAGYVKVSDKVQRPDWLLGAGSNGNVNANTTFSDFQNFIVLNLTPDLNPPINPTQQRLLQKIKKIIIKKILPLFWMTIRYHLP